jgi:hypothetical protein
MVQRVLREAFINMAAHCAKGANLPATQQIGTLTDFQLELLQSLDSTADNNPQPPAGKGISIVFHPALFWALVDPKISQMTPLYGESSSRPQDAMIRISTHYIHPLTETQVSQPASSQREESFDPFMFDVGELEEVNLNDIFSQFMPDIYDIQ